VPVVGIGQSEGFDEILVSDDETIGYRRAHEVTGSSQLAGVFRVSGNDGQFHLVEDPDSPSAPEQSYLGKADQEVALSSWVEHIGIEQRRERHASPPSLDLIVEAYRLRFPRQLVEDLLTGPVVALPIAENILEENLAPVSDTSIWEFALVEKLDQVGP
jgi:hypothetical protein